MRKLLIGLIVVLLLAVVLIAGFLFIPSPAQKWAVERGASAALGRKVTLDGPFHLRAWPPLAITASDVKIANADWGTAPELVQIKELELGADALAYWTSHMVKIDHLLVRQPQIHLEVGADGRRNWQFGDGASPGQAATETSNRSRCRASSSTISSSRTACSVTTTRCPVRAAASSSWRSRSGKALPTSRLRLPAVRRWTASVPLSPAPSPMLGRRQPAGAAPPPLR